MGTAPDDETSKIIKKSLFAIQLSSVSIFCFVWCWSITIQKGSNPSVPSSSSSETPLPHLLKIGRVDSNIGHGYDGLKKKRTVGLTMVKTCQNINLLNIIHFICGTKTDNQNFWSLPTCQTPLGSFCEAKIAVAVIGVPRFHVQSRVKAKFEDGNTCIPHFLKRWEPRGIFAMSSSMKLEDV